MRMGLLQKIVDLGITQKINSIHQQYIRIVNIINLLYIFAIAIPLLMAVILLSNDGVNSYARYLLLIGCSILGIILNGFRLHTFSKIATSITPIFTLIVFPIFYNHFIHAGMFLWIPYAIIALGIVPFSIFSFENEKTIMLSVICFYMFALFGLDEILMSVFNQLPDMSFIKKYYFYYMLAKIAIAIFLYSIFLTFKIMYYNNRVHLSNLTNELDQKNHELNILNVSLEKKVTERTAQLTLQNNRIKNLAHTNAHEIRAYIARIIGLMNISKQNTVSTTDLEYCQTKITENIIDLEKITQRLSKELIEEN
jgi:signal transduction histidine kinase